MKGRWLIGGFVVALVAAVGLLAANGWYRHENAVERDVHRVFAASGYDVSWVACTRWYDGHVTEARGGEDVSVATTWYWCTSHGGYSGVTCPGYDAQGRRVTLLPVDAICRERKASLAAA